MKKIYACLAGNWVCLNDDPDSKISEYSKSPYCWWEEGAPFILLVIRIKNLNTVFTVLTTFMFITRETTGELIQCLFKL